MNLEEKLYTSTEVADILGVSLRSVYRYLDEGKIQAEVKTATGRHRFTKQNIMDFLYPQGNSDNRAKETETAKEEVKTQPKKEIEYEEPIKAQTPKRVEVEEEVVEKEPVKAKPVKEEDEEPIDWLEKFRAAANKYKEEESPKTESINRVSEVTTAQPIQDESGQFFYYRSLTGGL
jgi:excisionase family DNA binding protein